MTPRSLTGFASLTVIVVVTAAVMVWATRTLPFLAAVESWLVDYRLATLLPAEPQDPDIVIVAITEEVIARFPYREPVDRRFLAELLRTLAERGVRGILLDVLFDQPTEPEKDDELQRTLTGLGVPLVVSYAGAGQGLTEAQIAWLDRFLPVSLRGFASLLTDPLDGTVRRLFSGAALPDGRFVRGAASALAVKLGYRPADGAVPIAWHGRPDQETLPFRQFRADLVKILPAAWFQDRIVLVGADLTLTDRHRTPFSTAVPGEAGNLPGVVIHAHGLAQLIGGRRPAEPEGGWAIAAVGIASLVGSLLARLPVSLLVRLPLSLAVLGLWWGGGFLVFREWGEIIPLMASSLGLAGAQWATDVYFGAQARRQRQFIELAFGRYLSRDLVHQLMADPSRLKLGGERRRLTIVITDIEGFTALSEQLDPETVSRLLNGYFDGVCSAVLDHGGMINEFLGDSVLAFFGAPVAQDDHAARGLACARAIHQFSERFRETCRGQGIGLGRTRVGVHSGEAVVGNFGSEARFKYVALGDTVNTASRIEGLNKHFSTHLLCSGATVEPSGDRATRPLGSVVLKGRREAVEIHEILPSTAASLAWLEAYRSAFTLMQAGSRDALPAFQALAAERPNDPVVACHLARLGAGARDAVVVMTEK
ncbi:MAG: CHASE2 domain-containing protein [Azospirillum sp.]|nr:CHASE2 domain-containing protein [Azospirillum sp.]